MVNSIARPILNHNYLPCCSCTFVPEECSDVNLQEDQGISHQQLPVIDMLLFSCDLFFSLSDSQGKNKPAHSINHSHGDHSWVSNKLLLIQSTTFHRIVCQTIKINLIGVCCPSNDYLAHNVPITQTKVVLLKLQGVLQDKILSMSTLT